jgi:hypothetical protein
MKRSRKSEEEEVIELAAKVVGNVLQSPGGKGFLERMKAHTEVESGHAVLTDDGWFVSVYSRSQQYRPTYQIRRGPPSEAGGTTFGLTAHSGELAGLVALLLRAYEEVNNCNLDEMARR